MIDEQLHWTPARLPQRDLLQGNTVRLEPIDVQRHGKALYDASDQDGAAHELFMYLPYGPFAGLHQFTTWLGAFATSNDPLFVAVVDLATNRPAGMASFMRMVPEHGVIEIGHIWFSPALQRTRQATEAIYLMVRHAFDLGYRRLEWKCDALNERSLGAALRFGFRYEGVFRQHLVVKDRNRDTAWFSILDREWPQIRAGFEAWLAPDNFETNGEQRRSLASIRADQSGAASE